MALDNDNIFALNDVFTLSRTSGRFESGQGLKVRLRATIVHNSIELKTSRLEAALIALLYLGAIFVSVYSYQAGGLYNDNLTFFSIFRDNAYSLNRFGAPAWWFPHINFGEPGYMPTFLGPSAGLSPAAVLFGSTLWLSGKAGFLITDFRLLYVAYAFAFLPTIFMGCVWLLSRRITSAHTRVALFAIAAFSPIVIQNLSDPGFIETAAYSVLCLYSFGLYMEQPARRRSIGLIVSLSLFLHTVNFTFLVWGLPFVLLLSWWILGPRSSRRIFLHALRHETSAGIAAGLTALAVAILPFISLLVRVGDFAKPGFGQLRYSLPGLVPGNPMQLLLASTPGIQFAWDFYRPSLEHPVVQFLPHPFMAAPAFGYVYLGLLCVPMLFVGLKYGRHSLRWRLGIATLAAFGVLILSGFSPLYGLASLAFPPLRVNNHYSDVFVSAGGCLIVLFLAVVGLERVLTGHKAAARLAMRATVITGILSLAFRFYILRGSPAEFGSITGLYLLLWLASVFVLNQLAAGPTVSAMRRNGWLLVAILSIDVATVSYWQVRSAITPKTATRDVAKTTSDGLGLTNRVATYSARGMLVPRMQIPFLGQTPDSAPLLQLVAGGANGSVGGKARLAGRTYNRLVVEVSSPVEADLLVRDAWDPLWSAAVEGVPSAIVRDGIFKRVPVPAGRSIVSFSYDPAALKLSLAASYLVLLGLLTLLVIASTGRQFYDGVAAASNN